MARRSPTTLLLSLSAAFGALGCGTDAVGVDACLTIERARCNAAQFCGRAEALACERHVEVQCLHGFSKSALPNERQANQCASALGQLAECVDRRGAKVSAETCELELSGSPPNNACALVDEPHELRACKFLAPADEEDDEEDEDPQEDEPKPDAGAADTPQTDAASLTDASAAASL